MSSTPTPSSSSSMSRLIVVSVDGMSAVDVPFASTLPGFARVLEGAWGSAESIYPTVTYPNHTSQTTGRFAAGHGVYANEPVQPGARRPDWFWDSRAVTAPTLFDLAAEAGLVSAAVGWPVTGWSESIDLAVPEIWDPDGLSETLGLLRDACSDRGRPYVDRHSGRIGWDGGPVFDRFVVDVAVDMIRREAPDLLFVHLAGVDSARHTTGRFSHEVREAFQGVDRGITRILAALDETGLADTTNIAIVSDHGHAEVGRSFRPNVLLVEEGLVRLDESGEVADWDAWVHGSGLTGLLHISPLADGAARARVLALVERWVDDPEVPVDAFRPLDDMFEDYGYLGPFLGVLEGTAGTIIQHLWEGRAQYGRLDADYGSLLSQHGHLPEQDIQPVFAMCGPDIAEGVRFTRCTITDEAVTFARLLGLEIPAADGAVVEEMLRAEAPVPAA
ncbi:alkaline phosphatase family protein [Brachybacterium sp. DNPG3]